jgi:hypothetical protein
MGENGQPDGPRGDLGQRPPEVAADGVEGDAREHDRRQSSRPEPSDEPDRVGSQPIAGEGNGHREQTHHREA